MSNVSELTLELSVKDPKELNKVFGNNFDINSDVNHGELKCLDVIKDGVSWFPIDLNKTKIRIGFDLGLDEVLAAENPIKGIGMVSIALAQYTNHLYESFLGKRKIGDIHLYTYRPNNVIEQVWNISKHLNQVSFSDIYNRTMKDIGYELKEILDKEGYTKQAEFRYKLIRTFLNRDTISRFIVHGVNQMNSVNISNISGIDRKGFIMLENYINSIIPESVATSVQFNPYGLAMFIKNLNEVPGYGDLLINKTRENNFKADYYEYKIIESGRRDERTFIKIELSHRGDPNLGWLKAIKENVKDVEMSGEVNMGEGWIGVIEDNGNDVDLRYKKVTA